MSDELLLEIAIKIAIIIGILFVFMLEYISAVELVVVIGALGTVTFGVKILFKHRKGK